MYTALGLAAVQPSAQSSSLIWRPLAHLSAALAATDRAAEEPKPLAGGMFPFTLIDSGGPFAHNRCFNDST